MEKYEEMNEETRKSVLFDAFLTSAAALILVNSLTLDNVGMSMFAGIIAIAHGTVGIYSVASDIAKKAGLESSINAIKEKLELLDLQNNQNNNNEEEKGRSL